CASFEEAVELAHRFTPRRTRENIRERLGHGMRELPDGGWTYKFDPNIANGAAEPEVLWASVRRLTCPTLLVRGGESLVLDDEGTARFRRDRPGAAVALVPGAGHSVMGDNPGRFPRGRRPFPRPPRDIAQALRRAGPGTAARGAARAGLPGSVSRPPRAAGRGTRRAARPPGGAAIRSSP